MNLNCLILIIRPMSSTSSSHTIVSESVGLEPIDYEEYVSNHSERDPLSQVGQYPPPLFHKGYSPSFILFCSPHPLQPCYPLHSGVCRVGKTPGLKKLSTVGFKGFIVFYWYFFGTFLTSIDKSDWQVWLPLLIQYLKRK